jgi:hypothetical protein
MFICCMLGFFLSSKEIHGDEFSFQVCYYLVFQLPFYSQCIYLIQSRIPIDFVLLYFSPRKVRACEHSNIPPTTTQLTIHSSTCIGAGTHKCPKCTQGGKDNVGQPLPISLPSQLTHLVLHNAEPLSQFHALPTSIAYLTLGGRFNHPVDNLPPNLIELYFADNFNQPLPDLPRSLSLLQVGDKFDQPVDNLPPCLQQLVFGANFNKPIDKLPPSLAGLKFRNKSVFNHPVGNLPASLQTLFLSRSFNRQIDNLPASLTHLYFDPNSHPKISELPSSLKILFICDVSIIRPFTSIWPPALKELDLVNFLTTDFEDIPPTLTHLTLFYETAATTYPDPSHLPCLKNLELHGDLTSTPNLGAFSSLTSLVMHHTAQLPTTYPPNLKKLKFCGSIAHPLDNLPPSLTLLKVNPQFNYPADNLPPSLTHLVLGESFNQALNQLPPSLYHLSLRKSKFNHPVDNLPKSLTFLSLGDAFNQSICSLPPSLTYLRLGKSFAESLDFLPQSLATLSVNFESLNEKGVKLEHLPAFVRVVHED